MRTISCGLLLTVLLVGSASADDFKIQDYEFIWYQGTLADVDFALVRTPGDTFIELSWSDRKVQLLPKDADRVAQAIARLASAREDRTLTVGEFKLAYSPDTPKHQLTIRHDRFMGPMIYLNPYRTDELVERLRQSAAMAEYLEARVNP